MPAHTATADSLFTFENVVSVLDLVIPNGRSSYLAHCVHPEHDDKNPSMVINKGRDGSALVACRSRRCEVYEYIFERIRETKANNTFTLRDVPKFDAKADDPFRPDRAQKVVDEAVDALTSAYAYDPFDDLPPIVQFLHSRGISEDIAKKLRFGYVSNYRFCFPVVKNGQKEWIEQYSDAVLLPAYYQAKLLGLKLRNIAPSDPKLKWSAMKSKVGRSDFNFLQYSDLSPDDASKPLLVFESNFDAAAAISKGANAATIPNAGFSESDLFLQSIKAAKKQHSKIVIIGDSDESGERAKERLHKLLGESSRVARVPTPHKDFGDFVKLDEDKAIAWMHEIEIEPETNDPDAHKWKSTFKTYDQLEQGALPFLVTNFIPWGVTFIGGLAGCGKTWVSLSLAKALSTAQPFLGQFEVPQCIPVLYLIPEVGDRSFRHRLEKMRLTNAPNFYCRTMTSELSSLNDPDLLEACRVLRPAVFLDTAIRFSSAGSENSASDNRQLSEGIFGLIKAGAKGVICAHHSPKASKKVAEMDLENTLRGSGDIGAIADCVWSLKRLDEDGGDFDLKLKCVKPRDFEPPKPFAIKGRPFLDETGDFGLTGDHGSQKVLAFIDTVTKKPNASYQDIADAIDVSKGSVGKWADRAGFEQNNGRWERLKSGLFAVPS